MAANAESAVSTGALRSIYLNQTVEGPVLQCLQIKQLKPLQNKSTSDVERYRCVFSDINNFIQSMLGTSLNPLVQNDKLKKGSFVRINNFQAQDVKGKKIIVILDCEVLEELGEREKIGAPVALEENAAKEENGVKKEDDQKQPGAINSNNFYGSKPQAPPQQRPQSSRPNGSSSSTHGNIYPIEALSPYAHKWTIRARCTYKGDIRTWHKNTGEGKLFSCNFLDESGEIRATGFNDQCDQLYDVINEGNVYYVSSPCAVKIANRKFSNLPHDYELTFERDTIVEKAEDQESAPKVKYNFIPLSDLENVEKDSTIDAIGVLKEVAETSQITSKTTGKPYDKRDLTICDQTGYQCRLTVWGSAATSFDVPEGSVVAFKGLKVSDFNGKSLSLLSSGSMAADPQMDEAYGLKGWYDAQGNTESFTSHAAVLGTTGGGGRKDQFKTIAAVKEEKLGMSEQTDYFTLKATIVYIKADGSIAYPACQSEGCNKKVIETDPGRWSCERCDRAFDAPEWRYIVSVNVSDWTGSCYLSCFDDVGRLIFGMTANDLIAMKDNDEARYKETVAEATMRTWVWRCRAKMDTFQDQQRVRYQVSAANAVNFSQEAARLADVLKQYNMEQDNGLFVPA
ncbi:MAG: hypothetical protein Q9159_000984 [Coniocarpon cinnabarinum]